MNKDYHIIAHDRGILDSSMILVYDQHDEREEEAQTPPAVDRIHLHFSDGLNENQPEIVVQTNNEDFLMDAVNAVKFKTVKNCTISASSAIRLKDEEKGGQDEKETVHSPTNIASATSSCSLELSSEETNDNNQDSKEERTGGCKTGQDNNGDICLSHREENSLVIETGHEKETTGNDNQNGQTSERSLGMGDNNSTVLHVQKEEEGQLYGEFIAKEDHVVLYKSHSKEAVSEDQSSAVTARNGNQAIPVCSSLQFLNTGDSIVVLTQDPSNIGLTSAEVSLNFLENGIL